MEISLPPLTAQRIRAALGDGVDLSPGTLPNVLARLAVEAPTVYSQVLSEISGSQIRLDSERELLRRRWRGLLRRVLFWWGEYESDVGDRLLAKRHVAAAVPLGMAGVILVLFVLSVAIGHRTLSHGHVAAVAHKIRQNHTPPHPAIPPTAAPPQRRAPSIALPFPDRALLGPASPPARPPLASLMPASPLGAAGPPGNPVVINLAPSPASPGAAAGRLRALPAGISPIVYDRAIEEGGGSGNPDHPPLAARPEAAAGMPDGSGAGALGSPAPPWVPGRRLSARLATGVVVAAGGPAVPVIAESADPRGTWLGRAVASPEGLVQITFALVSGGPGAVHGIAVDPNRLIPGLLGTTTLRHPRAVAAIVSAAAQAAADYVQALARQEQATIAGGWAQLTVGPAAPAWTYVAARMAPGLVPPGDAGAPVETTEIASGTPLVILVTEAP